jgi:hypothetical protein
LVASTKIEWCARTDCSRLRRSSSASLRTAAAEARLASGWEEPHGLLRVNALISFGRIHLAAQLIERYPSRH